MFKTLAKSRLAKFWSLQPRRVASGPHAARLSRPTHSNDNLPGLRRPAATPKRRSAPPALACHWFNRNGRLECRWQVETGDDAPAADLRRRARRGGFHTTVFELSYHAGRVRPS